MYISIDKYIGIQILKRKRVIPPFLYFYLFILFYFFSNSLKKEPNISSKHEREYGYTTKLITVKQTLAHTSYCIVFDIVEQ